MDEIDVRVVVSAFIENADPERFESVLLGILDANFLVFIEFLNDWEDSMKEKESAFLVIK